MLEVVIYTDGACHGNPGPGGWGAVIRADGAPEKQLYGGEKGTTNNRMELMAAISALEALSEKSRVVLWTDSQYVRNGISTWIYGWLRRDWVTASGGPVKNADLWQRLHRARNPHEVKFQWVRGHAGNEGNELADQLANRGAREFGGSR